MAPLLLGSHRAIDFLNTWRRPDGEIVETIGDGKAFGEWLVAVDLVAEEAIARLVRRAGSRAMDEAAAEARRFREWAREWLVRWRRAPAGRYSKEVEELNRILAREDRNRQVVAGREGLILSEVANFETPAALVSLPAADIAALITREDASLVRECAGEHCTLWFLDQTKAHNRRFCSAAVCGNRAKVAAFRERQRG
jgi:predicted RNA-binding Zn ribbon-like protein